MLCGTQITEQVISVEIWVGEMTLDVTEEPVQLLKESVGCLKVRGPPAFKASP